MELRKQFIPMLTVSKLSRLERAILAELAESGDEVGTIGERMDFLSWGVLAKLGYPSRYVWDGEEAIRRAYAKDPATAPLIAKLIRGLHRQSKLQTPAFRASFSRALKRLEARGLIKRMHLELKAEGGRLVWYEIINARRKTRVALTEEGEALLAKLPPFKRAN